MPADLTRRTALGAIAGGAFVACQKEQPQTSEVKPYRIIDPHVHVWKADPKYPWAAETKTPPAEDRTPEMLLELMKAHNVEKTVIIQVIHYRWDNSYLRDVLKQYPQYFKGVARVNPEDPAAPDHLSKLVEEDKMSGVRLSPAGNPAGDWIKGPLMPPLWKRCNELRVPMTILAPVVRMPDVAPLIESLPELTVVIDHMADSPIDKPEELDKLIALQKYPKVFVKLSHSWSLSKQEYPWRDTHDQIKRLYDSFGPQRLMWGTDWPVSERHATYGQTLSLIQDELKFLNEEDKSWILSRTVERVWPFA
ncbi:MAG: amidohydrolase [Bryobacterales bacterium]|nr:amidohydrolase [Bryobacterales bacterium]